MNFFKQIKNYIEVPKPSPFLQERFATNQTITKSIRSRKYKLTHINGQLHISRRFYDFWDMQTPRTQAIKIAKAKVDIVEQKNGFQLNYIVELNWVGKLFISIYLLPLLFGFIFLVSEKSPGAVLVILFMGITYGISVFSINNFEEDLRKDIPKLL